MVLLAMPNLRLVCVFLLAALVACSDESQNDICSVENIVDDVDDSDGVEASIPPGVGD